jgi:hypothetical protein
MLILAGPVPAALAWAGYVAIAAVLVAQVVRNLRGQGEPLKRIDRD